jgi:hypothetical protein
LLPLAVAAAACGSSDQAPSPEEQRLSTFERVVEAFLSRAPLEYPVDVDAIEARGRAELAADSTDDVLYTAIWEALRAFRKGHTAWALQPGTRCSAPGGPQTFGESPYGFCVAASDDAFIVTSVRDAAPLPLAVGDRIVAFDGVRGAAMVEAALARPACGPVPESTSSPGAEASALFVAHVAEGSSLTVAGADGVERVVVAGPTPPQAPTECPFGPFGQLGDRPSLTMVHDDVAWVRVPSFEPHDLAGHDVSSENQAKVDALRDAIEGVLNEAASHRGVVVDVRGNGGGLEELAGDLAAILPGARDTEFLQCSRKYGAELIPLGIDRFSPGTGARLTIPTVVLADGSSASATEIFALIVKHGTDALIVGSTTLGIYDGVDADIEPIEGTVPPMGLRASRLRCAAPDGTILEGHGVDPDVEVPLTAGDVRRGVDAALERAVALVIGPEADRTALLAGRSP